VGGVWRGGQKKIFRREEKRRIPEKAVKEGMN